MTRLPSYLKEELKRLLALMIASHWAGFLRRWAQEAMALEIRVS